MRALSTEERERMKAVAVTCVCGGWVMVAALGYDAVSDRQTFREAGGLAAQGFTVRSPLTVAETRNLKPCKHQGECTTNPEKVRARQLELTDTEAAR